MTSDLTPQSESSSHSSTDSADSADSNLDEESFIEGFRDVTVVTGIFVVFLILVTGVLTPLSSTTGDSMAPNLQNGDMVILVSEDRNAALSGVNESGIVTAEEGRELGYSRFGAPGDVIVFSPPNDSGRVIHRAMFYVYRGENWVNDANPAYLDGNTTCGEVMYCPAPHAGYITKGDNNLAYDQVKGYSSPVPESSVVGVVVIRVPYLGYIGVTLL